MAALKEELLPLCHRVYPQHPGGPGAVRYDRHLPGGHGAGRPAPSGDIWLRRSVQGRPPGEHRRRPTLAGWNRAPGCGASGLTTPTPTAPAAPCPAPSPPTWPRAMTWTRGGGAGQGLYFRGAGCYAGPGSRTGPAGPSLRSERGSLSDD